MNDEQLFPSDLVPLCQFDTRVNKLTDPHGVDYKAIVKAMDSKKLTRFQRGGRVYVSKSAADAYLSSIAVPESSVKCRSSRQEIEYERRIAALEREMADLRQQLGIQ
jgi:hypothetical protein